MAAVREYLQPIFFLNSLETKHAVIMLLLASVQCRAANLCTRPTGRDLDHPDPSLLLMVWCKICILVVHIQTRKPVLGHAEFSVSTRAHEVHLSG